jgi:hypothetical protein
MVQKCAYRRLHMLPAPVRLLSSLAVSVSLPRMFWGAAQKEALRSRGASGEGAMMAISQRKRTCFVIMPFGEKKDLDGHEIDFDDIYRFFFKKAIEDLGIECVRCDEIEEAGSIHEKMFTEIYNADIVVVDITTSNANVY